MSVLWEEAEPTLQMQTSGVTPLWELRLASETGTEMGSPRDPCRAKLGVPCWSQALVEVKELVVGGVWGSMQG